MGPEELAAVIDHTLLAPTATRDDVAALVREASELGAYAVCVSPSMLPLDVPDPLVVATVCGFPSGAHQPAVKAAEAADAVARGAHEVDMVLDLASVIAGDLAATTAEIATVRTACPPPTVLKVILETAALTDEQIVRCCGAAATAGADFVKTSTGFHSSGGASVHAVALMARTVGGRLGIKASGGIRTASAALAMIDAGATRLGLSAPGPILTELRRT